jgi:AcrR family transcriptional regulator
VEDKKEQVAGSFERHFKHFGFQKTSVADIAKELQISKKTIYQFFSTKEEIFYYIVKKVARQFCANMEKELADIRSPRRQLVRLIQMIFIETKKWLRHNDAFEFKYKYDIAKLAFQEAYEELFKKIIQEGIAKKEFAPVPVDLTVSFIKGIFTESMRIFNANPDLAMDEEVSASILKLLK